MISCSPDKIIIDESTNPDVFKFYNKLLMKNGEINRILLKTPRLIEGATIVKSSKDNSYHMPENFKRALNAVIKEEYLVIDRKERRITNKPYSEDTPSVMFIQALQTKAPESMKYLVQNNFSVKVKSRAYNSRSTCCFENVMITRIDDKTLELGFLPHPKCETSNYEKILVQNKIIKWYARYLD